MPPKGIPAKVRKAVERRSGGVCEARLGGCTWEATEIHHLLSRARSGKDVPDNLLHLDHACHRAITGHRIDTWAYRYSKQDSREVIAVKESIVRRFHRSRDEDAIGKKA